MSAPPTAPTGGPNAGGLGRLGEVVRFFLRLGATAFGGPAAHLALMQDELVDRRAWLSREQFRDYLGVVNLIPGPNSTEMSMLLGFHRAGYPGLFAGGAAFILPAAGITLVLALLYVHFGALPAVAGVLLGLKPAVLAVVVQAIARLLRGALRPFFVVLATAALALSLLLRAPELGILLGGGLAGLVVKMIGRWLERRQAGAGGTPLGSFLPGPLFASALASGLSGGLAKATLTLVAGSATLVGLGLVFLKIGSVIYGSGYVLVAFLRAELVEARGWLTPAQLVDAVAVGQFTPGPVFTTATFIGCLIRGPGGAAVATLGIFLPSFLLVAMAAPWAARLRAAPVVSGILDGVNAAAVGLMAAVVIQLAPDAMRSGLGWAIGAVAAPLLVFTRLNPTWILIGGGAVGLAGGLISSSPIGR